jgi:hypothetical protein
MCSVAPDLRAILADPPAVAALRIAATGQLIGSGRLDIEVRRLAADDLVQQLPSRQVSLSGRVGRCSKSPTANRPARSTNSR